MIDLNKISHTGDPEPTEVNPLPEPKVIDPIFDFLIAKVFLVAKGFWVTKVGKPIFSVVFGKTQIAETPQLINK